MKYAHFFLWLFRFCCFVSLCSLLCFSGELAFSYNMHGDSPYLLLLPEGRVSEALCDDTGSCVRNVLAEPLYFDVRTPRMFQNAWVTLVYSAGNQEHLALGVLADSSKQAFDLKEIPVGGMIQTVTREFDLSLAEYGLNRYRFVLSAPNYDASKELNIYSISFDFRENQ